MDNENVLTIKNLEKSFGKIKAVRGINLEVKKGDVFGFLGPNGAGKSTTIKMVLNLIIPDKGNILINGFDVRTEYTKVLQNIGIMVETPSFYEYLTGYDNLKLTANLYEEVKHVDIINLLKKVGLKNRAKNKVSTYSVGMKQRLGLARALLNQPQLVILDEPTSVLDPQGKKGIRELITTLSEIEDITFFICTHMLNEVEQICNRVAIIQEGKIISKRVIGEKQNKRWVEFYTRQKKEAIQILKNSENVKKIETNKNGILLFIEDKQIEDINNLLFDQGIKVKYIIPEVQSIEEYYLKETGGRFNVI